MSVFSLEDLEAWMYKGFRGLTAMAYSRATEHPEVAVQESTIGRLESLCDRLGELIVEIEKMPVGGLSPDEWDAWHIMCFRFLLMVVEERVKYGSSVRGGTLSQNLCLELSKLRGIVTGYRMLNQRLQ